MIMAWYDFFNFKLGEHVIVVPMKAPLVIPSSAQFAVSEQEIKGEDKLIDKHAVPSTPTTPLLSRPVPDSPILNIIDVPLPADKRVAQLTGKISTLDNVMYYDQLAVTFVVAILQGTKKAVDSSNSNFNLSMDILSFALPATITFINGVLKGVRDSAIQEKTNLILRP
jgi:hypothetical protein